MKNRTIKDPTYSIYKDGGNVENKAKAAGKQEFKQAEKFTVTKLPEDKKETKKTQKRT